MKLKFHTGEIIDVKDEHLLRVLKQDKRYTEVKDVKKTSKKEEVEDKKPLQ